MAVQLEGTREDVIGVLALVLGSKEKAAAKFDAATAYLRGEAEAGAKNAIPEIQAKVKTTVTPLVGAAIAAGALGFVMGVTGIIIAKRAARRA